MSDNKNFASKERMAALCNNALDVIATLVRHGGIGHNDELYSWLSEDVGMTDDEIRLAGFDCLPDEPEKDCPSEILHPQYNASITISQKDADFYNVLLGMNGRAIYDKYGLKRDECPCKLTGSFPNGYQMDIDLVICEEESPYLNIVLFDANGNEVNCEAGEAPINDDYCLSDVTGDYFVEIIADTDAPRQLREVYVPIGAPVIDGMPSGFFEFDDFWRTHTSDKGFTLRYLRNDGKIVQ